MFASTPGDDRQRGLAILVSRAAKIVLAGSIKIENASSSNLDGLPHGQDDTSVSPFAPIENYIYCRRPFS